MTEFIDRKITQAIENAAASFPVITITGPRQSGKTTLARHMFPEYPYFSLENPDVRNLAMEDPVGFLNNTTEGIILDEVQNSPQLMSYIQGIVDNDYEKRFILTGSNNFSMLKNVSQSLAGRSAVFELLPFSINELNNYEADTDSLIYKGGYPGIWCDGKDTYTFYSNYVTTYLERDVRNIINIKDLNTFQKFIRICATRIGSIWNSSEVSNEIGASVNTVKSWLSVLQASYIIFMLQPIFTKTRKRLTKSPKLFFTDTGLASFLLEIESESQIKRDKMRGHLFENMIVAEALKQRLNAGRSNNLCFYRDSNGNEVDLITKREGMLNLYEIKSSETYHPDFEKGIKSFIGSFGDIVGSNSIIYNGSLENESREIKLITTNICLQLCKFAVVLQIYIIKTHNKAKE